MSSLEAMLQYFEYQQYFIPLFFICAGFVWFSRLKPANASGMPRVRGWLPGNLDILWRLVYYDSHEYCGETLREWAEIYGPTYDMNILWGHQIVTVDPENVKHMLVSDFEAFGKGSSFYLMLKPFLGGGIFSVDGDEWKTRRVLAKPFFSNENIFREGHLETMNLYVSKVMDAISLHTQHNEAFNIQDIYSRLTFDIGMNFLFGDNVSTEDEGYLLFSKAFTRVSEIATRRIRIGSNWRLFEFGRESMEEPMKCINSFIEPIVQKALSESAGGEYLEEHSFLKHLTSTHRDPDAVKDELLNFLLAIRDTTASLLTFTTYMLVSSPDIILRLREEVTSVMNNRERIIPSDIQRMPYLRSVLNEVLRLFPPVPFNIRRCLRDSTLPSPLSRSGPLPIRRGVSVTYVPFIIQRRHDLWGGNAQSFDPGRWLRGSPRAPSLHSFAFHPFHGGPRLCLGQQYAYVECSYIIIRLLETLEQAALVAAPLPSIVLRRKELQELHTVPCWPKASLTLYCKGGLWIRMQRQDMHA